MFKEEIEIQLKKETENPTEFKYLKFPCKLEFFNEGEIHRIEDQNSFDSLTNYQKAFCVLLSKKISSIIDHVSSIINEEISDSIWENSIDIIKDQTDNEWVINFAVGLEDTIVHGYMDGWDFAYHVNTY